MPPPVTLNTVGSGFTVRIIDVWHEVGIVYTMVEIPAVTPPAKPEEEPIVATGKLLLVHVPPAGVEFKLVVRPTHTLAEPVMPDGRGLTVIGKVAVQPAGNV